MGRFTSGAKPAPRVLRYMPGRVGGALGGGGAGGPQRGGYPEGGGGWGGGPAGAVPEGGGGGACWEAGGGAATGTAGDAVERDGVFYGAVGGVFVGAAHGEFVAICFAEKDGAGGFEAFDGGGVVGGEMIFENFGAAGGADAARGKNVFDGDRNSGERGKRFVCGDERVDSFGLGVGAFGGES